MRNGDMRAEAANRALQGWRVRFAARGAGQATLSWAVARNRRCGGPDVLGVGPNHFDHQSGFIGTVDFPRHAIGLAKHDVPGFGEVSPVIGR